MNERASRRTSGELPADATHFIGRRRELARLADVLGRARLVTLTGPGGVGKTRTAVRAAHRARRDFPDGVYMVHLSALTDPELLANTVAAALDLPEQAARPAIEIVADHLEDKAALLVLDTCEHLVDACAMLCDTLLPAAPRLRIMTTSRQPLDVVGEHVLPVSPMEVPDGPQEADATAPCDALLLFEDRAEAAVAGFTVNDDNRAEVLALCRRLDGIPLAIELAVSRLRVLSLEEMLGRLDDRFRILTGGRRTCVPRHQTLRTAIAWSHDLSTDQERVLWARLSVFAGELSLSAAEEVCSDDRTLPPEEVLDALIGLVEKSVVLRVETPDGTRYRMLDTIREFGLDQLAGTGEAERTRARHLAHFLGKARDFDRRWTTDAQLPLLRALVHDQANLRAALEYCASPQGPACDGLELATALWGYWHCTGLLTEGRYWLRRALDDCPGDSPTRVKALWVKSWFMDLQGERGNNEVLLREAEETAARIGDQLGQAWTLAFQAHRRYFEGRFEGCADDFDEVRSQLSGLGDEQGLLMLGFYAGFMLILDGDLDKGIAWCDDSLSRNAEQPQEQWARSWALWVKSVGLWLQGGKEGREASVECAREGIRCKAALHDMMGLAHFLEGLAWYAATLRHFERVAVLQGAADALWRRAAKEARFAIPVLHELHDVAAREAREALGADGYHESFSEGGRLSPEAAVEAALQQSTAEAPAVPAQRPGPAEGLTPRERQVAALVSEGLTNKEIAAQLVVSKRTVDSHVEHILTKLGFGSRSQIAAMHGASGAVRQ
ncbi:MULTISPECIES: LuxR C-terminal-related transcriptional regulator [unclassified Streptomyces]|uniref:ATP-binding protein n=1 Tax=unclassified Streptomyces TaxID=2593676 RepID=UPI000DB9F378|nr:MULTISPECIES: LuxR C-terminal-related transcriptional regulator [unclassified Streptomyces]MYT74880.1 AAA family ATPase [Streptomyces sp. SID8367]RAJ91867.1 putative ATPase [Streptomyces sp. PsTaAH-137]